MIRMYRLYEITAVRSDGLPCSGTINCKPSEIESRLQKAFKPFTVQHGKRINCQVHWPDRAGGWICSRHGGETFSFSQLAWKEISQ